MRVERHLVAYILTLELELEDHEVWYSPLVKVFYMVVISMSSQTLEVVYLINLVSFLFNVFIIY